METIETEGLRKISIRDLMNYTIILKAIKYTDKIIQPIEKE